MKIFEDRRLKTKMGELGFTRNAREKWRDMVMVQVSYVMRGWGWVSSMLTKHFTFKEEKIIRFFRMDSGVMPIIE